MVSVAAESIDYNDYVTNVEVDGNNDLVTVRIPAKFAFIDIFECHSDGSYTRLVNGSGAVPFAFRTNVNYRILVYPFGWRQEVNNGLDLSLLPEGATITSRFGFDYDGDVGYITTDSFVIDYVYLSKDSVSIIDHDSVTLPNSVWWYITDTYTLPFVPNADLLNVEYYADKVTFYDWLPVGVYAEDTILTISISSLLRQQQLTGKTNAILQEVEKQLAEQGKNLEDIRDQMQDANDKLDELPGEIGDEMQSVINSEKEQSKSEGNKFVDQVLDKLPDPSQGVLSALSELTAAVGYTGTEAVIPFPSIVVPGINGLFDDIVIYKGSDFDLSACIDYIPDTLLTVVRNLFTIAIVLFCVYELKGIISFIFTLKEKNNG